MFELFFFGCIGLAIYYFGRDKSASPNNQIQQPDITDSNQQWAEFIAGYHALAKTKTEKKLIEQMLNDLGKQGFAVPIVGDMKSLEVGAVHPAEVDSTPAVVYEPEASSNESSNVQLDNASLLLYFGAFLFVASVGLFVAFGGLPGTLRTFAVALVAITMYTGGLWLFRNKTKLEQAGVAFAGIGLATAPFVGLAAYNFIFDQTSGPVVWFVTSVACLALYLHALVTLKKPLLNYVLIFTFLSLIESGISIVNVPLYYYGWGLAATGLLLSILSKRFPLGADLQDASYSSASLFMPVASAASVVMVGSQGAGQLGVSLLLAAVFYTSEYWYGLRSERVNNAIVAQISGTLSIGAFSYAFTPSLWFVGEVLLVTSVLKAVITGVRSKSSEVWANFASITILVGMASVFLCLERPGLVLCSLAGLIFTTVVVWQKQKRLDAYCVAVLALMVVPLVLGQLYLSPRMDITVQTFSSLSALLLQWAVVISIKHNDNKAWLQTVRSLYLLSGASVLATAFFASPMIFLVVSAVVAISMLLLAEQERSAEWASVSGLVISLPVIQSVGNNAWFLTSILIGLMINIAIALYYRQELTRWLGMGLWFVLPISLGNGMISHWNATEYAWAYFVVALGLIFARAIARGVVLLSSKVPLASYAKSASVSYVVGYSSALAVSIMCSLSGVNSQLHTSILLGATLGIIVLLAHKIERRADLYTLVPLVAQALLLSAMRISTSDALFDIYLLCSSLLAAVGYLIVITDGGKHAFRTQAYKAIREGSLVAAAIAPLSFMFVGETTIMMPLGLLVFTGLLYHASKDQDQSSHEGIIGLGLVAIWWFMWFIGVRNVQAYSHVLAALFAVYAYWRHIRGEKEAVDQYLVAMLGTATIPLVLQALGGAAGGLYGWWLLLEQVFFMLLGMSIGKSLVTRWGLYVSVGAVLYQLRNLGWAALTVLALFLIGLAVYRLQKLEDKTK